MSILSKLNILVRFELFTFSFLGFEEHPFYRAFLIQNSCSFRFTEAMFLPCYILFELETSIKGYARKLKTHELFWQILFAYQNFVYVVCFAI